MAQLKAVQTEAVQKTVIKTMGEMLSFVFTHIESDRDHFFELSEDDQIGFIHDCTYLCESNCDEFFLSSAETKKELWISVVEWSEGKRAGSFDSFYLNS